ncbi:MAG TPA: prolipoprotein diacylglyceryl transferase family protein [Candidatus Binatia bacterium]|nr:prolipoprotein diacylglyceryl transferase family protein [Candidatus Binatia bacterium]
MPLGVIQISLDPVLRLSETSSVRYETIGLGVVILLGLIVAARIATRTPSGLPFDPEAGLRVDDLVFIVVGSVPGAILGGRLGYVLDHLEFYRANPGAILDPAQGGLTLTLAVPFGMLTGAFIARLLGAPVGRWLHAAALPLLFVLSAGKLAGVLGATGQGTFSDALWATAYEGPGPWGSLAAEVPAHPAQAYEAIAVAGAIVVMALLTRLGVVTRRQGGAMFLALALWSVARLAVATTWRDPVVVAGLRTEQLLQLAVLGVAVIGLAARWRVPASAPAWPDPEKVTETAPEKALEETPEETSERTPEGTPA